MIKSVEKWWRATDSLEASAKSWLLKHGELIKGLAVGGVAGNLVAAHVCPSTAIALLNMWWLAVTAAVLLALSITRAEEDTKTERSG